MLKPSFCISLAIACVSFLAESAIALPPPSVQPDATMRLDANAPLCYIQFQGSNAIDVSSVCGKTPGEAPDDTPVSRSKPVASAVFDPKVTNASTTGQCNFIDANGNPCPRNQPQ